MLDYRHCDEWNVIYDKHNVLIIEQDNIKYGFAVKVLVNNEEVYDGGYEE